MSRGMPLPTVCGSDQTTAGSLEYPPMADTNRRKKIDCRVQPDKDDDFSKHARKVIEQHLRGFGERDTYLIDDVIQDTLENLCKHNKLNERVTKDSYIRKAAKWRWLDLLRADRRIDSLDDMPEGVKEAITTHRYPIRPSDQEVDVSLQEEQQQLSEDDGETFKLMREGKENGSIAKETETTEQGVKQRRHRIKTRLGLAIPQQRRKKAESEGT